MKRRPEKFPLHVAPRVRVHLGISATRLAVLEVMGDLGGECSYSDLMVGLGEREVPLVLSRRELVNLVSAMRGSGLLAPPDENWRDKRGGKVLALPGDWVEQVRGGNG